MEFRTLRDGLEEYMGRRASPKREGCAELSLVITSYTNERLSDLFDLLDSGKIQTHSVEFVLVVERDVLLRDKLLDYLNRSGLNWMLIFSKNRLGISNSRNLGADNSKCDLIGFVDDDAILFPDWAEQAIESMRKHEDAIGATGRVYPMWSDKSTTWFPHSLYWLIGCSDWKSSRVDEYTDFISGVNMIFRRQAFQYVKFKDEFTDGAQEEGKMGLPNEDNDFAVRLGSKSGLRFIYNPRLNVYHKVAPFKVTNKYVRRYSFWQGMAEARYSSTLRVRNRGPSRGAFLSTFIKDILSSFKANRKKRFVALGTFVLFASLGYISYHSSSLRKSMVKQI